MNKLPLSVLATVIALAGGCRDFVLTSGALRSGGEDDTSLLAEVAEPLFADDFERTDGPDIGNGWIEKTPAVFAIANGGVVKTASWNYRDNVVYRPDTEDIGDVQAQVEFTNTAENRYVTGYPQLWVRIQGATVESVDTLDGYLLYIPNDPRTAAIARQRGQDTEQDLARFDLEQPIAPGGVYRLTLSATGSNPSVALTAEVERRDGAAWQTIGRAAVTDEAAARVGGAGAVGFSGSTSGGRYVYDNFVYGAAADGPVPPPSPAPPPSGSAFADDFARPDGSDIGSGWIEKSPPVFSLRDAMVVKAASNDYRDNLVYRPASEDVLDVHASLQFTVTTDNPFAPGYPQLWVRVRSDTVARPNTLDGYGLFIENRPTGAVLARQRGNAYVQELAAIELSEPVVPGGVYRLALRASGSDPFVTLTAEVERFIDAAWQSIGRAEVDDDSAIRLAPPGTVGFGGSTSGGRYAYDNFAYRSVGEPPPPANQPPVADFTLSCSGLTCSFANRSDDADGTIVASGWTFGDGATSTARSPSHTYEQGGSYRVTLTATDDQGARSAPASRTVTVAAPNQPPMADFTFSCSGLTCSFANRSDDRDGAVVGSSWAFGDGATSTARNPWHTYRNGGSYTVTLVVTDDDGARSAPASRTVTVAEPNRPPVVDAGEDSIVLLGARYWLNASFTDPGDDGPWRYRIDWGDGSSATGSTTRTGTITRDHTYTGLLATRTIRVAVTDSRGATGADTKTVTLILGGLGL